MVVERKVAELCEEAEVELQWVLDGGGSFAMIDEMKGRIVQSGAERVRRIESGELKVVGVNSFTETEPSPLAEIAQHGGIVTIDPDARSASTCRRSRRGARRATRRRSTPRSRDAAGGRPDVGEPGARDDRARQGGRDRRRVGGRAARGVRRVPRADRRRRGRGAARRRAGSGPGAGADDHRRRRAGRSGCSSASPASTATRTAPSRSRWRPAMPGSRSIYQGIRLTPGRDRGRGPRRGRRRGRASRSSPAPTSAWCRRSCGSCGRPGSTRRSWSAASSRTPTAPQLEAMGVARVYTPKDYRLSVMMRDLAELARIHRSKPQAGATVGR